MPTEVQTFFKQRKVAQNALDALDGEKVTSKESEKPQEIQEEPKVQAQDPEAPKQE